MRRLGEPSDLIRQICRYGQLIWRGRPKKDRVDTELAQNQLITNCDSAQLGAEAVENLCKFVSCRCVLERIWERWSPDQSVDECGMASDDESDRRQRRERLFVRRGWNDPGVETGRDIEDRLK